MKVVRVIFLTMFPLAAAAEEKTPSFSLTYNVAETVGFLLVGKIIGNEATYLPFHFDAHVRLKDSVDFSFGLVYRYEDYNT